MIDYIHEQKISFLKKLIEQGLLERRITADFFKACHSTYFTIHCSIVEIHTADFEVKVSYKAVFSRNKHSHNSEIFKKRKSPKNKKNQEIKIANQEIKVIKRKRITSEKDKKIKQEQKK